ncbi:FMN reductase [Ensifer aridi]|uniref:FMN reductase n=1 Tax=Ensifer aridi TaxID=1708715 RepID=UPI00061535CD|nr:FMN reductase [Ensifer aridi]
MPPLKLVGLAGSYSRPSKSRTLVEEVSALASERYGFRRRIYDLHDAGPFLGQAQRFEDLDPNGRQLIEDIIAADVLVVGSPTYKGSYPGLFKHLIDLIEPLALRGKPIVVTATGGGDRHALMVEHQLRPLFGFFMAHTLPTAIYASDRDFSDSRITAESLRQRIVQAVDELEAFFPVLARPAAAAE